MKDYLVVWSINISAENAEEAALEAEHAREHFDAKAYEVIDSNLTTIYSLDDMAQYKVLEKSFVDLDTFMNR